MKAYKGNTYLVLIQETTNIRTGWVVKQTSMKGWTAMQFTAPTTHYGETSVITGNSMEIFDKLEELLAIGEVLEVWTTSDKADMRATMFNILKYGRFTKEEEL